MNSKTDIFVDHSTAIIFRKQVFPILGTYRTHKRIAMFKIIKEYPEAITEYANLWAFSKDINILNGKKLTQYSDNKYAIAIPSDEGDDGITVPYINLECNAPTYDQIHHWFKRLHKIDIAVIPTTVQILDIMCIRYSFLITKTYEKENDILINISQNKFIDYYECYEEAILFALEHYQNIIKI